MRTHQVVLEVVAWRPVLVGITAMTLDILWAANVAEGIKTDLPQVLSVICDPHAGWREMILC